MKIMDYALSGNWNNFHDGYVASIAVSSKYVTIIYYKIKSANDSLLLIWFEIKNLTEYQLVYHYEYVDGNASNDENFFLYHEPIKSQSIICKQFPQHISKQLPNIKQNC